MSRNVIIDDGPQRTGEEGLEIRDGFWDGFCLGLGCPEMDWSGSVWAPFPASWIAEMVMQKDAKWCRFDLFPPRKIGRRGALWGGRWHASPKQAPNLQLLHARLTDAFQCQNSD